MRMKKIIAGIVASALTITSVAVTGIVVNAADETCPVNVKTGSIAKGKEVATFEKGDEFFSQLLNYETFNIKFQISEEVAANVNASGQWQLSNVFSMFFEDKAGEYDYSGSTNTAQVGLPNPYDGTIFNSTDTYTATVSTSKLLETAKEALETDDDETAIANAKVIMQVGWVDSVNVISAELTDPIDNENPKTPIEATIDYAEVEIKANGIYNWQGSTSIKVDGFSAETLGDFNVSTMTVKFIATEATSGGESFDVSKISYQIQIGAHDTNPDTTSEWPWIVVGSSSFDAETNEVTVTADISAALKGFDSDIQFTGFNLIVAVAKDDAEDTIALTIGKDTSENPKTPIETTIDEATVEIVANGEWNWQGLTAFTVDGFSAETFGNFNVSKLTVNFKVAKATSGGKSFDPSKISYQIQIGAYDESNDNYPWIVDGSSSFNAETNEVTVTANIAEAIKNYDSDVQFTGFKLIAMVQTADAEDTIKLWIGELVPATGVALNEDAITLEKDDTFTLKATVSPDNSSDEVVWSSSDKTVATVEDGVVTAVGKGTTTITAKAGDFSAECEVTVTISASAVTLNKTTLALVKDETFTLEATVDPSNSTDKVVWKSSDETIATVEDGVVTAVATGETTITATAGKATATCIVKVTNPVKKITLDQDSLFLLVDGTAKLTATVTPADADEKTVTWTTSDETVATVEDGVVTAVGKGTATITAKAGDKTATCEVTVAAPAKNIYIEDITILVGDEKTVVITVDPEGANISNIKYASSDESIFTVTDGKIKGVSKGTATLTVTAANQGQQKLTAECTITVTEEAIAATEIKLSDTAVELEVDGTKPLTATLTPADSTDKITWTSSDETVVSVDETGKITALKVGEATITAKANETVSAQCKVTVVAKTIAVDSISLDKTTANLNKGDTLELTATVKPDDATDKTVTWASSDEKVVTVDEKGVVTAIGAGKAVVTAKAGSKTATCEITVTVPVASVTLNKNELTLEKDGSEVLTAVVAPEDAADKTVTWSSSNATVATVDQSGKVTAVGAGTATITVVSNADETKKATCVVTVTEPEPEPEITSDTSDTSEPDPDVTSGSSDANEPDPDVTSGSSDVNEPDPDVTSGSSDVNEPDPDVTSGSSDVNEPDPDETSGSSDVNEPDPDVTSGSSNEPDPDVTSGTDTSNPEEPKPEVTEGAASGETDVKNGTDIKIEIPELGVTLEANAETFEEAVSKIIADVEIKLADASEEEKAAVIAAAIESLANASDAVSVNEVISVTLKDQDGNTVQPVNGTTVKVTLPHDGKSNYVAYIGENDVEFIKLTIADGYASFEAKHFSDYYLVSLSDDAVKAVEGEEPANTTTAESASNGSNGGSNPSTGIVVAVVPAIVSAAAAIIFKKRK